VEPEAVVREGVEKVLPLLGKVWKRVRSFRLADCRVVGDVDALVPGDGGPGAFPDDDAGGGAL
jgi:hypothetical protein